MILLGHTYSYEAILDQMRVLQKQYPDILQKKLIGMTGDRRLVTAMILGKGKQTLICTGGIHGRESINPIVLLKMIEWYCECYCTKKSINDLSVFDLFQQYQIVWIPLMNPDGYEAARKGFGIINNPCYRQAAKMRKIPFTEWKYNARGVDINRNFPSEYYKPLHLGDKPGSEPETCMLMEVFKEYDSIGYFDFHSRGKTLYYYRNALSEYYNELQKKIALHLQQFCGYRLGQPAEEMSDPSSGGNSVQYYAEVYKKTAITIETVADEVTFPIPAILQKEVFGEISILPLAFLQWHADHEDMV